MSAPIPVLPSTLFSGQDVPAEDDLYKCVHCGFCLQACPTYIETGLETESPRGRIALMKAVNEGRLGITPSVFKHWDLCIQCRACEVACPSGVPYGRLIESTMAQVKRHRRMKLFPRLITNILLRYILPCQNRLGLVVGALRFFQQSGLRNVARKTRALRLISNSLAELEKSAPEVPAFTFKAEGQIIPAKVSRRARVALLSGCVMPLVNGPEMEGVVRVLARNGCEVVVTKGQVCCGAINSHVGDLDVARSMAKHNIDAFLASDVDAVVVASAGCGVRMKEYDILLRGDEEYCQKAEKFSAMVRDVHEFLVDLPFNPPQVHLDYRVTYQDSCHLSHAQRVTEPPRELLRSIPGLVFTEMDNSTRCCGAGGTYSITQREFSLKLLDSKMSTVKDTSAEVVATANPGCMIQLKYGANRVGIPLKVRYVIDLLDEAYGDE